jgi:hypothetical protein
MSIRDFVGLARQTLAGELHRNGSILYSAAHTLSPGPIYFMGLNPGGDPSKHSPTIADDLAGLATRTCNAFEQAWDSRVSHHTPGAAPLQKRIRYVIEDVLGFRLRDVCATNLVFMQTHDAGGLQFAQDAQRCWPVHAHMLDIVKPKLILTYGNSTLSPYGFLKQRLAPATEEAIPSGHGTWQCKAFDSQINGRPISIVGLPHLSRYSPMNKPAITSWLQHKASHVA